MAENSQDRKASFIVSAENDTKSTFQEIKADAAEMAGSVEKAGERAARGVSSIGDGAEVAAQKLTREEGRMSSALIRATEQARIAAQAGTSMAKAFELKADMRGMDMSRITPLAAELRKAEQALAEYKAQQAQAASQTSFIDSLRAQAEAVGKTRLELLELKAAQLGITTQASPYIAQLRNAENAQGRLGKTAGELQWALRGVPAQLSDIAVSIEGGMPLMTVFMQQGFQLRDMFGSWGAAGRGVAMSLIGMVTPLTAVSAGVLALTAAYYYGSKERDAFLRSLVMTGDVAGVSTDGLVIMSRQISDSVGTQAKATEALVAFVDAGVKGQSELRKYTQTAIEWERATGEGVDKTAAKFASLQEDPLAAVQKLNEGTNFLTAAVYEQIKSLQDQGDETAAAEVAMDALDTAMRDRSKRIVESLGWIEKAWRGIKDAAAGAAETMANAGRPPTKEDELQRVRTLISNKQVGLSSYENTDAGRQVKEEIEGLRQQEWALLSAINDEVLGGVQSNADRLALAARVASDKAHEKYKPKSEKKDDEQAARKRVYDELIDKNGYRYTPEQLAKEKATFEADMAAISKKYEDKSPKGSSKPARDALSIDVNATKRDLDVLTATYSSAQKIMEAQRAAGLVDDKTYYEEKRKYINLEADAQEKLLRAEMDRYKQEKVTKDNRLQVEKGIADTQAKLDKAGIERKTALEVLTTQQNSALNAQKASINAAEQAAQDYLLTLQKGFDRTVNAVGWGSERRNVESGKQQIEDRYAGQRRDLENQRAQIEMQTGLELNAQQQELYDSRLAIIKKHEALALNAYDNGVQRRLEAEGNWLIGVDRAYQDYRSSAANVVQQSADMFGNAFKGMEDALTSFVTTGKADFKSLANSIIADIVRTQIRAQSSGLFGSLVNGITGFFGGSPVSAGDGASAASILNTGIGFGSLAGGRATGGGVLPRSIYEVNERDVPELASFGGRQYLMTADQPGSVTPLAQAAATMPGRAVVSGGSMPSVRVELINKGGQAAEVTSASLGMDADGGLLVRAVIDQAKKAAVQEVASQTAGDYGDMGQAMRQRERMGMR